MGFFRPPRAPVITSAAQSRREEIHGREVRYVVTMSVRVVCFVLAVVLFHGWLRWVMVALAAVLPWLAVVAANQPHRLSSRRPESVKPKPSSPLPPAPDRVVDGEWHRVSRRQLDGRTHQRGSAKSEQ